MKNKPVKRLPERSRRTGAGSVARVSRADAGSAARCWCERSRVVYSGSSAVEVMVRTWVQTNRQAVTPTEWAEEL